MSSQLFTDARQIALALGLFALLPIVVYQSADIIYPLPIFSDIVQAKYGEAEYNTQKKVYDDTSKIIHRKHFYINAGAGLMFIASGTIVGVPSIGTGMILGGLVCVSTGYFFGWNTIDKTIRLISLLIALAVLLAAGFNFYKE
jgi:uncharacterized membrane protein SpoIIM required for sporulation